MYKVQLRGGVARAGPGTMLPRRPAAHVQERAWHPHRVRPGLRNGAELQLYEENDILGILGQQKVTLIRPDSPDDLAGLLHLTDRKSVEHCLLFARKGGAAHPH